MARAVPRATRASTAQPSIATLRPGRPEARACSPPWARPTPPAPGRLGQPLRGTGAQRSGAAHLPLPAPALLARRRHRRRRRCSAPGSTAAEHPLLGAVIAARAARALTCTGRSRSPPSPGWPTTPSPAPCCCPAPPSWSWRCGPAKEAGAPTRRRADPAGAPGPARARRGAAAGLRSPPPTSGRAPRAVDPLAPRGGRGRRGAAVGLPRRRAPRGTEQPADPEPLGAWPPAGAEPLEVAGPLRAPGRGRLRLRPRLPGPRAAWRHGEEVYAEVALAEERRARPRASASTRRCSTPPCTPTRAGSAAEEQAPAPARSPGAASACRAAGATAAAGPAPPAGRRAPPPSTPAPTGDRWIDRDRRAARLAARRPAHSTAAPARAVAGRRRPRAPAGQLDVATWPITADRPSARAAVARRPCRLRPAAAEADCRPPRPLDRRPCAGVAGLAGPGQQGRLALSSSPRRAVAAADGQ